MAGSKTLNGSVLVLNRNFQPVHIVGVKDAMRLLISDKCQIVDQNYHCFNTEEWAQHSEQSRQDVIRTVSRQFLIPEVVRLLEFDRRIRYTINYTRDNIFFRDSYSCQYCGKKLTKKDATIDHIIPKSRIEEFDITTQQMQSWDNVITSCGKCNTRKSNRTPQEAGMRLLSQPTRPAWAAGSVRGLHEANIKPSWTIYLEHLKIKKSEG